MVDRDPLLEEDRDEVSLVGLLKPLWSHRRFLVVFVLTVSALAFLAAGANYIWWQPQRWMASVEFRPVFEGASDGKYPNKLPFAPSDMIDPSILDQVFDANQIQQYCGRNDFRAAFALEKRSYQLVIIDTDYQSRLSDIRLNPVERQRLQDAYMARRASVPEQYAVTLVRPEQCSPLPAPVAAKVLDEVLRTWAVDAEQKRGVLKQRVRVLTPSVFDVESGGANSAFIRANLVWTNVDRVIRNITDVELLPGSELVRFGEKKVSLAEVRAKLSDLQHAHLETLISSFSGGTQDRDAVRWVEDALNNALNQQQLSRDRASANLEALREYSGVPQQTRSLRTETTRPQGTDVQTLTPQIDDTFIDRILRMSAQDSAFRQELTRAYVETSLEAVGYATVVDHYEHLLAALRKGGDGISAAAFATRLQDVAERAKALTREFNGLYDEWSSASFRAAPQMYVTLRPAAVEIIRPYPMKSYVLPLALAFAAAVVLGVLGVLAYAKIGPSFRGEK